MSLNTRGSLMRNSAAAAAPRKRARGAARVTHAILTADSVVLPQGGDPCDFVTELRIAEGGSCK